MTAPNRWATGGPDGMRIGHGRADIRVDAGRSRDHLFEARPATSVGETESRED